MQMSNYVTGFVKADEFEDEYRETAHITAIASHEFEEARKAILYLDIFKGRGFVLNQTNLQTMIAAFGSDSENWAGQAVTVTRTFADYKGKRVPAIRLRALRRPAVAAPAAAPVGATALPPVLRDDDDDYRGVDPSTIERF